MLGNTFEVLTMKDCDINIDIVENGKTCEDNALIKVRALKPYADGKDWILMGDDTGLFVDCLDGTPGVYSARYAGEQATYADNNAKLLKVMADCPKPGGAEFVCAIALSIPMVTKKPSAAWYEVSLPSTIAEITDSVTIRCSSMRLPGRRTAKWMKPKRMPSATGRLLSLRLKRH